MSKRVIILERLDSPRLQFRFAMWADVPAARQSIYANPTAVSAWKDAATADQTALQIGTIAERVETVSVEPGTTLAQVQAMLQARFAAYQSDITNDLEWSRYGSYWDDATGWTLAGK
jgi:hypothetical protein